MLLKLPEWTQREDKFNRVYIGTVVSNADPLKLRRIKVMIPGMLAGDVSALPWIYSMADSFLGASSASVSFAIPEVGSKVVIESPYKSIYSLFYGKSFYDASSKVATFNQNYPHSYGFADSDGNWFRIDKVAHTTEFYHSSGTSFTINADGAVDVDSTLIRTTGDVAIAGNLLVSGTAHVVGTILSDSNISDLGGAHGTIGGFRATFESHTHTEHGTGGGTTGSPNQTIPGE